MNIQRRKIEYLIAAVYETNCGMLLVLRPYSMYHDFSASRRIFAWQTVQIVGYYL